MVGDKALNVQLVWLKHHSRLKIPPALPKGRPRPMTSAPQQLSLSCHKSWHSVHGLLPLCCHCSYEVLRIRRVLIKAHWESEVSHTSGLFAQVSDFLPSVIKTRLSQDFNVATQCCDTVLFTLVNGIWTTIMSQLLLLSAVHHGFLSLLDRLVCKTRLGGTEQTHPVKMVALELVLHVDTPWHSKAFPCALMGHSVHGVAPLAESTITLGLEWRECEGRGSWLRR